MRDDHIGTRPARTGKVILGALAAHAKKETDFGVYACFGTYAEVTQPGSIAVGDRFALGA